MLHIEIPLELKKHFKPTRFPHKAFIGTDVEVQYGSAERTHGSMNRYIKALQGYQIMCSWRLLQFNDPLISLGGRGESAYRPRINSTNVEIREMKKLLSTFTELVPEANLDAQHKKSQVV